MADKDKWVDLQEFGKRQDKDTYRLDAKQSAQMKAGHDEITKVYEDADRWSLLVIFLLGVAAGVVGALIVGVFGG